MREWRVVFVLLAIVILLGVLVGVKIINNTPEKQEESFKESYNETKYESMNDFEEIQKGLQKRVLKESIGLILVVGLVGGLLIVSNVKIYNKLGIDGLIIKLYIISCIASFAVIFTFSNTLSSITSVISGILSILLLVMQYKILGINPWLLLLGFIPVVGFLALGILMIYGQCKLAEYFGKGTGFQLGLIFLPIIFIPILAFSAE